MQRLHSSCGSPIMQHGSMTQKRSGYQNHDSVPRLARFAPRACRTPRHFTREQLPAARTVGGPGCSALHTCSSALEQAHQRADDQVHIVIYLDASGQCAGLHSLWKCNQHSVSDAIVAFAGVNDALRYAQLLASPGSPQTGISTVSCTQLMTFCSARGYTLEVEGLGSNVAPPDRSVATERWERCSGEWASDQDPVTTGIHSGTGKPTGHAHNTLPPCTAQALPHQQRSCEAAVTEPIAVRAHAAAHGAHGANAQPASSVAQAAVSAVAAGNAVGSIRRRADDVQRVVYSIAHRSDA